MKELALALLEATKQYAIALEAYRRSGDRFDEMEMLHKQDAMAEAQQNMWDAAHAAALEILK